jgi:hypothetical protein
MAYVSAWYPDVKHTHIDVNNPGAHTECGSRLLKNMMVMFINERLSKVHLMMASFGTTNVYLTGEGVLIPIMQILHAGIDNVYKVYAEIRNREIALTSLKIVAGISCERYKVLHECRSSEDAITLVRSAFKWAPEYEREVPGEEPSLEGDTVTNRFYDLTGDALINEITSMVSENYINKAHL